MIGSAPPIGENFEGEADFAMIGALPELFPETRCEFSMRFNEPQPMRHAAEVAR